MSAKRQRLVHRVQHCLKEIVQALEHRSIEQARKVNARESRARVVSPTHGGGQNPFTEYAIPSIDERSRQQFRGVHRLAE